MQYLGGGEDVSDLAESCSDSTSATGFVFTIDIGLRTVVVVEGETSGSTTLTEDKLDVRSNLTLLPGEAVTRERAEDFFDVTKPVNDHHSTEKALKEEGDTLV